MPRSTRLVSVLLLGLGLLAWLWTSARSGAPAAVSSVQQAGALPAEYWSAAAPEVPWVGDPALQRRGVTAVVAGENVQQPGPRAGLVLRVLDAGGEPVPGARVALRPAAGGALVGRSDTEGRVELRANAPGFAELRIDAAGHSSPRPIELHLQAGEILEREVRLSPGTTVRGRVFDTQSALPVAGAWVGESAHKSTRTDAQGCFELRGFSDAHLDLRVRAEGYGDHVVRVRTRFGAAPREVEVHLLPARRCRGRVLGGDGQGLPGAQVVAVGTDRVPMGSRSMQRMDRKEAETDAEGNFVIEGLRADMRHSLLVRRHGHGTVVHDFPAYELEQRDIDLGSLRLAAAAELHGRVVDEHLEPVAGAVVVVEGCNSDRRRRSVDGDAAEDQRLLDTYVARRELRSDCEGRFALRDLPPGRFEIHASLRGKHQRVSQELQLVAGEVLDGPRLQLFRGREIRGRLCVADGGAVPKTYLSVDPEGGQGTSADVEVGPDGRFVVTGLAAGHYRLTAYPYPSADDKLRGRRFASTIRRRVLAGSEEVEIGLPLRSRAPGKAPRGP